MRIFGINVSELIAGLLVIAIGAFATVKGLSYPLGTARDMGPGYVPLLVGIILVGTGIGIIFVEGRRGDGDALELPALRSLLTITAAVLAFALTIDRFGLLVAVFLAGFLATITDRRLSLLRSAVIAAVLSAFAIVIFHYGLGLQARVLPW